MSIVFKALRIVSILLILAAIPQQPMEFYFWLRWIVFATLLLGIFLAGRAKRFAWVAIFVVFAAIFNPFAPLMISRELWITADVILIGSLLASLLVPKVKLG